MFVEFPFAPYFYWCSVDSFYSNRHTMVVKCLSFTKPPEISSCPKSYLISSWWIQLLTPFGVFVRALTLLIYKVATLALEHQVILYMYVSSLGRPSLFLAHIANYENLVIQGNLGLWLLALTAVGDFDQQLAPCLLVVVLHPHLHMYWNVLLICITT